MHLFISSLYMFRASQCSSSGGRIVLIHHLVCLVRLTPKKILATNKLYAIFHVFIYLFHLSTCFEHHNARHQEIELY